MGDNLNGIFANMIQGMGFIGCAPNRVYNMAPPDEGGVEATAEGTELTLHSAAAPLTALTLYGKSEQRTTTGAQLINLPDIEESNLNGITWSCKDGIVSVSGTATANSSSGAVDIGCDLLLDPGTYFVSGSNGDVKSYVAIIKDSQTSYYFDNVFTVDGTEEKVYSFLQVDSGNTINANTKAYPMLNKGTTALPWEPYTGGAPSPSPDYPQEIKSVGDSGTVNVTLSDDGSQSQTLPVQTPNGLPGIPVSSGGNYTDADGQQWVCDEVDFERGVFVKRVDKYVAQNAQFSASGMFWNLLINGGRGYLDNAFADDSIKVLCDMFPKIFMNGSFGFFYLIASSDMPWDIDTLNSKITGKEITFFYPCVVTETPLSPSELAAYAALRTYSPTTVVSNDAEAWMKVGYKATPQPMTMLARKR